MIDTHTHLNFGVFADDWKQVVDDAVAAGVKTIIVVGADVASSKKAVMMCDQHDNLVASVGIHPHHVKQYLDDSGEQQYAEDFLEITHLASHNKVVAIGEVGIDMHTYESSSKYAPSMHEDEWKHYLDWQKRVFVDHISLSNDILKPLVMHSREAGDMVLDILTQHHTSNALGVFHCFDGSKPYVRKIISQGYYVSFTGNITLDEGRARTSLEVPLERLLLETDSPYMSPLAHRGKRNQPQHVQEVARKHAELRSLHLDEVNHQTTLNAQALFGL